MDDLFTLIYWSTVAFILGGVVGFVLRVRLRWLVLGFALLLFVPFVIPGGIYMGETVVSVFWTAGFAGGAWVGGKLRSRLSARRTRRRQPPKTDAEWSRDVEPLIQSAVGTHGDHPPS